METDFKYAWKVPVVGATIQRWSKGRLGALVRLIPTAVIAAWTIGATYYCFHTPDSRYSMDFDGHVQYGRILSIESRLPTPTEGWETFQPPLYYLLVSRIPHSWASAVTLVRVCSVLLGTAFLSIIAWCLRRFGIAALSAAGILAFIATTPQFVFHFSTYNNDALANLFALGLFVLVWLLRDEPKNWKTDWRIYALFACTVAGLYTKYNVGFAGLAAAAFATYLWIARRYSTVQLRRVLVTLAVSALALTPWLYARNYRQAHVILGHDCGQRLNGGMRLPVGPLTAVLTPPCFTNGEWTDPYVHHWDFRNTKKRSYLAYLFSSSIFGEYEFNSIPAWALWLITWLQLAALVFGLRSAAAMDSAREMRFALFGSVISLIPYIFQCPFAPCMHFRFIAWTWLPLAFLYAAAWRSAPTLSIECHGKESGRLSLSINAVGTLLMVGTALQLWLLSTLTTR